ncbi:sigma-54-dependent Fis family transcriptional regulator [Lacipirellula limnantheis]|uniref:Formate hydrogenlyase transcriptional activator n=1 Tax=Lacipirellula limnantheis TaxID=2528024 RepID=A0A517TZ09_9BACT|nr:sigma 54-interacting transcriptional regulator [Lacipirellula limnantheis]QDT73602.1 Formate hydrogenlyase transcriptional activator [Lacipirellula limnantheis]
MAISFQSTGLIGDPKRLLLDLAGRYHVSELLPLAVQRLAEGPAVALVRIWLVQPPLSDDCEKCRLAAECQNQDRCLHLVASAGQSLDSSLAAWERLNGAFRRFPIGTRKVGQIAKTGQSLEVVDVANDQAWAADPAWIREERIASFAGHPLVHRGEVLGVLGVFAREAPGESCFEWLRMIADHLAAAIANARAMDEIESLKKRLEQENEYLREEVQQSAAFGDLIGQAPALQAVTRQIELVAPTNSSVLILGESGTGKEVVAREIHRHSHRAERPLIKVNCAAVPRELYESEFFGHVKGAFTGALRDRAGRFELADGGTLFLDEIGEIPLDLQAKLLRVLQEGEIERIGEERTRRIDVRVIVATNRNLRAEAEAGRFRQDLYYRLSVFPMELPPLRKRIEDIPLLAEHFLSRFARQLGRPRHRLTLANVQELQGYDWPGNVRELQHALERACIVAADGRLRFDFPEVASKHRAKPLASNSIKQVLTDAEVRTFEANNIKAALAECNGKVYGSKGAAELLKMKPTTLNSRIKALGIKE